VPEEPEEQQQQGEGETPPETGSPAGSSSPSSASGETPPAEGKPKVVPVAELASERKRRKDAERELQELRTFKQQQEDAKKTDAERAADKVQQAETRAEQAEARLRRLAIGQAVHNAAAKAGFRDPADAVLLIGAEGIDLDDDGLPIQTSVDAAVKAAAKAKPHWLHQEGERGTGSKFGGQGKGRDGLDDSQLRAYFPALGPPRRTQS
jgi:hypothetical protein